MSLMPMEAAECKCRNCLCNCDLAEREADNAGGASFLYKCRTCGKRILRRYADGRWTLVRLDEETIEREII